MKLLKVIIILSSIFVFSANARGGELSETEGSFENMPYPTFLGEGIEYSMPAFLFRLTQFMRFSLKKEEKKYRASISDKYYQYEDIND